MNWSDAADSMLQALVGMVPETLRELAGAAARDESEAVAEQRNGLIAVIESLGIEPERYAEELESSEGWDEFEEPPDSGM